MAKMAGIGNIAVIGNHQKFVSFNGVSFNSRFGHYRGHVWKHVFPIPVSPEMAVLAVIGETRIRDVSYNVHLGYFG